ncbi:hypothetical protein F5Y19DRAFT_470367 [Xylariaceae sp. FL1651]|nr:hypothetical protein F5Y19DRAFT_470367 [Xylariaceae sp. FL1651]
MAVIQGLKGLEVTIYTNGRTAKEYDDPSGTDDVHRRPRMITKYIECDGNEPFRIHLKATKEYLWGYKNHALNFAALIDGIWAKGELCQQEDTKDEEWERDISYRVVRNPDDPARYVYQEFAFAAIIKVDWAINERRESDIEQMERIGTIEVKVYRTLLQENGPAFVPAGEHPKDFFIHQEATRGKTQSHGTIFTCTQPATKPSYVQCANLKEDNGPLAVFRFRYRSREGLRLEGITPDPRAASDWIVEISDDDTKDSIAQGTSIHGRNPLKKDDKPKKEITEQTRIVDDLAPPRSGSDASQNHTPGSSRSTHEVQSIFPHFELPRSRFQNLFSRNGDCNTKTPGNTVTRGIGETITLDIDNRQVPTRRNTVTAQRSKNFTLSRTKREGSVITQDKGQVIDVEDYHKSIERVQDLRQEFDRISNDLFKEIESHRRPGRAPAPGTSAPKSTTRVPPSRRPEVERPMISKRAATAEHRPNYTGYMQLITGMGAGPDVSRNVQKEEPKAVKRESGDTADVARGPICAPRPFKVRRMADGREAIDLVGSDGDD